MQNNLGLHSKRNIPLITNSFDGHAGYININLDNSNLIMDIPLFNDEEFGLSLKYSFLNRNENILFGNGINISLLKFISNVSFTDTLNSIEITNEDFSKVTYNDIYNCGVLKNGSVDNRIVLIRDEKTNVITQAMLIDNSNNYYLYDLLDSTRFIPCKYHKSTDESDVFVNFLVSDNMLSIEYKNKVLEITITDEKIEKISYKVNDSEHYYLELLYENDFLVSIKKYVSFTDENGTLINTLIEDREYVLNNTNYILSKNLINGYYSKYYLSEHCDSLYVVSQYINSYKNEDEKYTISYLTDTDIKVTDYKGNYLKYHLDDGKISYVYDSKKNITNYEYDENRRLIKSIGPVNMDSGVNKNKVNLFKDITLDNISYSIDLNEDNNVAIVDGDLYVTGSNAFTICVEKEANINKGTGLTFMAELVRSTSNDNLEVEYELYFGDEDSKVIKKSVNGNVLTGLSVNTDLSKVYLFISVPASSGEFVIKNIQLFNDLYGSIYKYDASGLLIKETNTLTTKEYRYNVDNYNVLVRNKINKESSCIYNYDYRNRIKEILYSNGCSRHFEYDRDYVVRVVTKDGKGNFTEEKKSYYLTKTKPYKVTNSLGEEIYISYDQNERLITNSRKENSYEEIFSYNSDLTLKEKTFYANANNKITHKYYYDSKRRLEKIVLNDAYSIKYSYDDYGNITSVGLFNDDGYTNFERFNYEVNDDNVYTGNLKEHRIGKILNNDNKYVYEYDNYDRLIKVYISNPTTNTLITEFEYDSEDKLIKMHDYKNDEEEISEFIYDEYNNLCKVLKTKGDEVVVTEYKYSNNNEKVFVNNSVLGKNHYYGYTVDKKSKRSPLNVHNYFNNKSKEIYSNFLLMKKDEYVKTEEITYDASGVPIAEGIVEYRDIYELNVISDLLYGDKSIKLSDTVIKPGVSLIGNNNVSAFRLLNNGVNLKYEVANEYKTYSMWFKFDTLDEGNIIFAVDKVNTGFQKFTVLLTEDNKIQLKQNINFTESIVLTVDEIEPYDWNFVCLSFGENNTSKLYVNGSIYEFTTNIDTVTKERIYFGYDSLVGDDTQNINGYVTCMTVSSLLTDSEVKELYEVTNDNYIYFSKEESDSYNDTIVYTHNYKMKDGFSLIPLNNTFKCINDDINHKVYYKVNYEDINKSEFEYVDGFKKYGYNAVGNDLVYTGFMPLTLVFREFSKKYIQDQTLFEVIAGSNKIGLKINENGLLIGYVNDYEEESDILVASNTVHNFKVGIKEVNNSSETVRRYKMNIIINGESFDIYSQQISSFSSDVFVHIGCKESGFDPLNGYIDMLYMGNTYDEANDYTGFNLLDTISKTVDTLGFLRSNEVSHNNECVIKKEYKYKEETVNNSSNELAHGLTKCYNIIEEEVIILKDEERKIVYGYNDNNQVQKVEHYTGLAKKKDWFYYYDSFNRVTGEFQLHNMNRRMYEYDMLGNITKKYDYEVEAGDEYNTILFGYDTIWPDRLKTITKDGVTKTVEYDSSLFGYPVAIGVLTDGVMTPEVTLEWKRNELKKYTSGINEYTFNYNTNGQRISKVYNRLGDYIYKYYYYSDDLLVLEKVIDDIKGDEYTIEYLYDESSMLYGFVYSNKVYYYLKDVLGNIIGIINEEGSLVCEYEYDAYGEHKVTNLIGNVGNINPFRYKGYYYDEETNLALVSSRYYSPELGRFIQPADVSTLNLSSINGLNLYGYANNNPIGIAYGSSSAGVSVVNQLINQNFSSLIVPNLGIIKNNNSSSVHWKNEWFATDWPSFLVFSNKKAALIDWGLSIYKGSLYFDEAEKHSIYIGVGNVSVFAGYNVEKEKYGVFADVNVLSVAYDGRYIDAGISVVGVGFILGWEDKKFRFKIDPPGWFGFEISIDFGQIIKDIFGWEWRY